MIQINIDYNDELLQRKIRRFPDLLRRATKSALSSMGNDIRDELRKYVESGYVEGPRLHPLTLGRKQRLTKEGRSVLARRRSHGGPLSWMGKFARYAVWGEGQNTTLAIGYGRSRKGEKLTSRQQLADALLTMYARKHEYGRRIRVTGGMRRLFGAAGFPLRKTTSHITIPRRRTISVIKQRIEGRVQQQFKEKFIERLRRYQLEAE